MQIGDVYKTHSNSKKIMNIQKTKVKGKFKNWNSKFCRMV